MFIQLKYIFLFHVPNTKKPFLNQKPQRQTLMTTMPHNRFSHSYISYMVLIFIIFFFFAFVFLFSSPFRSNSVFFFYFFLLQTNFHVVNNKYLARCRCMYVFLSNLSNQEVVQVGGFHVTRIQFSHSNSLYFCRSVSHSLLLCDRVYTCVLKASFFF